MATLLVLYGEKDKKYKETMKRLFFLGLALLLAGVTANAQLGITRDGQLRTCKIHKYTEYMVPALLSPCYDEDGIKYLPHTKSVTRVRYDIKYDHTNEEWEQKKDYSEYKVVRYDTTGKITDISYYENGSISYKNTIYFIYEGNRLSEIQGCFPDHIKLKYDNRGFLNRILYKEADRISTRDWECQLTWGTQANYPLNVKFFKDGKLHQTWTYKKDANGRIVVTINPSSNGGKTSARTEKKRDKNGNVTEIMTYYMKEIGKYYTDGQRFVYEYSFYGDNTNPYAGTTWEQDNGWPYKVTFTESQYEITKVSFPYNEVKNIAAGTYTFFDDTIFLDTDIQFEFRKHTVRNIKVDGNRLILYERERSEDVGYDIFLKKK